jgi:CheY-like chemotaxis protein/anti-sigma regulatory factor (Ser/Thr protein kinase)
MSVRPAATTGSPQSHRAAAENRSFSKKILIVEDDPHEREGLRMLLERSGFRASTAVDGIEALETIRRDTFDLLLVDLGLPGMSGHELIAQLPESGRTRIVILSGNDTPESVLSALREKTCHYLIKPIDSQQLLEVIRETLELPGGADQIELLSADPHWVELRFPCDQRIAKCVEEYLRNLDADLPERVREPVELAVHEMVRNAIEWGGHSDPKSKVQITCLRTDKLLLYRIADPGAGFDPASLKHAAAGDSSGDPCAHIAVREEQGLRPGGFGILIARSLVDELMYNEAHNEVLVLKYLNKS